MKVVIIVIGAVALFLFLIWPQILSAKSLRKNRGKVVEGLDRIIGKEAAEQLHQVLYFFGPGCGKCRSMTPRIDELGNKFSNLYKVNSEEHRDWAIQFGVVGLPSVAVVRDGRLEHLMLGSVSSRRLSNLLSQRSPES